MIRKKFLALIQRKTTDFFNPNNPKWSLCIIASIGLISLLSGFVFQNKAENNNPAIETTDTYIPKGFVLVPVELVNAHSVSSLMGSFTIVDIYESNDFSDKKGKIITEHVRMIRAPLDNSQFAVLIDENDHDTIQRLSNPAFAVIKNPNQVKNEIKKPETKPSGKSKIRIVYGD